MKVIYITQFRTCMFQLCDLLALTPLIDNYKYYVELHQRLSYSATCWSITIIDVTVFT